MDLVSKKCKPCEGGVPKLTESETVNLLSSLANWEYKDDKIFKVFRFQNYYQTMAFVNAIAWISHQENHHPDLEVHYKECKVIYFTHAIGGLSENDFICAAKVDDLTPMAKN